MTNRDRDTKHGGSCPPAAGRLPVARLFWLGVFVLHLPALAALCSSVWAALPGSVSPIAVVRLVGLLLSAGFFFLKIVDVEWLRLKPGWRSAVAAAIVLAVIHVGVFERAVGGDLECSPAHLGVVFFVGTVWQAERVKQGLAVLRSVVRPSGVTGSRRDALAYRGPACEFVRRLPALLAVPSYAGPRAPPSL